MRRFLLTPLLLALVACTTPEDPPPVSSSPVATSPSASPGIGAAASPVLAASPAASPAEAIGAPSPSAIAAPASGLDGPIEDSNAIPLATLGSWRDFDRGGGNNVVDVENRKDGAFRARGNAELDRIRGDNVTPSNIAQAHASCTDCQTIAAAVQVVVYQRGAQSIAPVNRAVAVNDQCTRCVTVARAIQWVIPVDDVREVPRQVGELVRRVDREANYFERIRDVDDVDTREAQARLNQLEADFVTLQQYLSDLQDTKQDNSTPTPGASASPASSPSASASASVSASPSPTGAARTPAPSPRAATAIPVASPAAGR
jgi:putative peptide zinc metalloprotease protein